MKFEVPVLTRMNGEFIYKRLLTLTEDERANFLLFFEKTSSTQLSLTLDSLINDYNTIDREGDELSVYAKGFMNGQINSLVNVQEYLLLEISKLIAGLDSNTLTDDEEEQEININQIKLEVLETTLVYVNEELEKVKQKLNEEE